MVPELNQIIHADCMDIMRDIPNKYFELAIVDPPYFKGVANKDYFNSKIKNTRKENLSNIPIWNKGIPDEKYYEELKRVSNNQIIWGCNYYKFIQPAGRIVWDKCNENTPFSDCELASISLIKSVRIFRYKWNGMIQENMTDKEIRIHPTQKPVALYRWLLINYANPGDKIIDTHSGSGSCAIACHLEKFDFLAIEKDADYYEASVKRFDEVRAQLGLF